MPVLEKARALAAMPANSLRLVGHRVRVHRILRRAHAGTWRPHPDDCEGLKDAAQRLLAARKWLPALHAATAATQCKAGDAEAWHQLGQAHLGLDDAQEACKSFRQALAALAEESAPSVSASAVLVSMAKACMRISHTAKAAERDVWIEEALNSLLRALRLNPGARKAIRGEPLFEDLQGSINLLAPFSQILQGPKTPATPGDE